MNLAMNFNAIDTKKKVSIGLLILYAALGILPFIQKEEPPRKSTWAVTSIQSTPTSNQAEQFRPSAFSQSHHWLFHRNLLRGFNSTFVVPVLFLKSKNEALNSASFKLSNQALLAEISWHHSRILRI